MRKFVCMAAVAVMFVAGCKNEEPKKVAMINMAKVFASHPALKLINPQVNAQKSGVQEKVQKAAKLISEKEVQLRSILETGDKDKKENLVKEINSDKAKLNQFVQQGNQKLGVMQKNVRDQLLVSLVQLVDEYRIANNYSFVLDYSGMTGNNMASVVCFDKENDITEKILEKVTALKVSYNKDAETSEAQEKK
jgi:Skp family chaperone for outer membrane proteins